jgi:hypothetical protein
MTLRESSPEEEAAIHRFFPRGLPGPDAITPDVAKRILEETKEALKRDAPRRTMQAARLDETARHFRFTR